MLSSCALRLRSLISLVLLGGSACASSQGAATAVAAPSPAGAPAEVPAPGRASPAQLEAELVAKYGEAQADRIHRGLEQLASLWRPADGDLAAFARAQFIGDPKVLDATFERLEGTLEQLDGHFNEMGRWLKRGTDLNLGPLLGIDPLLGSYDPEAHQTSDLFKNQIAFVVLLNFPLTTLEQRLAAGPKYTRRQWAELRLAERFARRVPAEVTQEITQAGAASSLYIDEYNLWMHHILDEQGERRWPKDLRLISHWGLRDELKADYLEPQALAKQRTIVQIFSRIVTQTIPLAVINNPRVDWNPFSNAVVAAPPAEIETDAPSAQPFQALDAREPDTRYAHLLANFHAERKVDPYSPIAPTKIVRSFEIGREIPESRVKNLLETILTSPLVARTAAVIEKRLGRHLEPQDLWYSGFRTKLPTTQLDPLIRKRYPTAQAFAADIPRMLRGLGFSRTRAKYLAERIVVDPSRGAGHAMPSLRRGDFPHLRTRIEPGGMNYKGYNIAIHELGHNVEQVFSLYDVDHTLLASVPNSAFTEALAFVFQARDLELLGVAQKKPQSEQLGVLNDFWMTFEIAGVALVDLATWHWMYAHPQASAAELRVAVVQIAQDTWKQYYAPVLGGRDVALLGAYSHMISYPLYLADYPLGHLIAFQIEAQLRRARSFGAEFERMARLGRVTPDLWMINATGAPVGPEPLLRATENALKGL